MSRIRTSIHGRQLGLDHDNRLLAPNGLVLGNNGMQRTLGGPNTVSLWEDFTDGFDTTKWRLTIGTDDGASTIGAADPDGVYRLQSGDAGTGLAADGAQLTLSTAFFRPLNGFLAFEAKTKISIATTSVVFIGLTDTQAASLEVPIQSASSADTLTSNASDAVGFMYDTNMATDNIWLVGVNDDVDATAQDTGAAMPVNEWQTFRIEVDIAGNANFFINGNQVGTTMIEAVDHVETFTPVFYIGKHSVTASNRLSIDYIHVTNTRNPNG